MTRRLSLAESCALKREKIHTADLTDGAPLANAPADRSLLYTRPELAFLLKPLMGLDAPRDDSNRILEVRPKGHWFEFETARKLGYHYPPGAGLFPDLRHQLLEVKHHTGKSTTIDFGHHHPGSKQVLEVRWNSIVRARVCDIRYLIALAPPPAFKVTVMVLATGAEINSIFGVSPTKTIKYPLGISNKWRAEHAGQILVSGRPFNA
ncbi:MAG: hypothetical protein HYY93_01755 [Planctomycetes bacterium]|nr:hypothetical protein [Planctomycetota bacterium]